LLEGRSIATEVRMALGIGVNIFSDEPLIKQDYKIATLNQSLNLNIELAQFSATINAALSSLIEQRNEIANYSSKKLLELTLNEINETVLSLGRPIYRKDNYDIIDLKENGHLQLRTDSGEIIDLNEGEDLIWPNYC